MATATDYRKLVDEKRQEMLNMLIESMETNPQKWVKGWYAVDVPFNAVTLNNYNGLNALFLAIAADRKGYKDPRWVTFNQAKELGASIKSGEKASDVFYYSKYDKATKKPFDATVLDGMTSEEQVAYLRDNVSTVLKYYNVFNAEQCDKFPKNTREVGMSAEELQSQNQRIEKIITNSAAPVSYDGRNQAYYSPISDSIHLPQIESFKTMNDYYATALHEIGHSTGHSSRLNRDLSGDFGSKSYAIEELRAELSSAFMQSDLGINLSGAEIANHAAYLKSWLSVVKEDPNVFYRAAADAGKITKYIKENYLEKTVALATENTKGVSGAESEKPAEQEVIVQVGTVEQVDNGMTFEQKRGEYEIKFKGLRLSTSELPKDVRDATLWLIKNGYQNEDEVQSALHSRMTSSWSDEPRAEEKDNARIKKVYQKYFEGTKKEISQQAEQEVVVQVGTAETAPITAEVVSEPTERKKATAAWIAGKREKRFADLEKNVPETMKALPNWCAFKTRYVPETKNEAGQIVQAHYEKKPWNCNELKPGEQPYAKCNDPSTWTTFSKALEFARNNGCDGLSFALTPGSGVFCIDLDKCKVEGKYSPLAWGVFNAGKGTYVEKSVSGAGLHLFGMKDPNVNFTALGNKSADGALEFYDRDRFMSMTGDIFMKSKSELKTFSETDKLLASTKELLPQRPQLNPVESYHNSESDSAVIERIRNSKKGSEFNRLFAGEDICGDFSRSDLKLLNMLAFFTNGDAEQMKRIYLQSGLNREGKSRGYLDRSINMALASVYDKPRNIAHPISTNQLKMKL